MAFEPEPATFKLLKQNLDVNAIETIEARNVACGDEDGSIHFHTGINGYTLLPGHHQFSPTDSDVLQVPCVRLDSLFSDRKVAFIKIDVEGFEWQVLQGAAEIIRRDRPALIVEIHPPQLRDRGASAEQVLSFLKTFYTRIDLYMPRPRSQTKWARLIDGYRQTGRHCRLSESAFARLVGEKSSPGQIYAVCRA